MFESSFEIDRRGFVDFKKSLNYEHITQVSREKKTVLINNTYKIATHSEVFAQSLSTLIKQIIGLSIENRQSLIERFIRERYNEKTFENRLNILKNSRMFMFICTTSIFLIFLFIIPYVLYYFSHWVNLVFCLIALYFLIFLISFLSYRLIKKLQIEDQIDKLSFLLVSFIYPLHSLSLFERISVEALSMHHPALVADKVLPRASKLNFLRIIYGEISQPLITPSEENKFYLDLEREVLMNFFKKSKIQTNHLVPTKDASDIVSYCPRCFQQYVTHHEKCYTCTDIRLVKF